MELEILRSSSTEEKEDLASSGYKLRDLLAKFCRDLALVALVGGGKENDALVREVVKHIQESKGDVLEFQIWMREEGSE